MTSMNGIPNFGSIFSKQPDLAPEDIQSREEMMAAVEREREYQLRIAIGVHQLFTSPDGAAFLEILKNNTTRLSLMNVQDTIGASERQIPVNPAEWAYYREGQNSVCRWITSLMDQAEAEMRKPNNQKEQGE